MKPLPAECQRELADLLSQEEICLARLAASLEKELSALESRDLEELEQAVMNKREALQQTGELHHRRAKLLQQFGFSNNDAGVYSCIARCSPNLSRELTTLWQNLHIWTARCRDLNMVSGRILESNIRCIQQALTILRSGSQPLELYGPQGTTRGQNPSTPLARA